MSKLPEVTGNNISQIKQIGPAFKGIFLVKAGSSFVIKREQTDLHASLIASNNWANKVMRKATDGGSVLKVKALSKQEITSFLQYLAKQDVRNQLIANAEAKGTQQRKDCIDILDDLQRLGTTALFVKMPYNKQMANGTDIDDRATLRIAENTAVWFKAIDKSSFWKSLGQISAIDHFNSNFDRIGFNLNGISERWEISNPGNLIVYSNKVLAVDAWNSARFTNAEADYTQDLTPAVKNGLDVMKDFDKLGKFIEEVMNSIFDFLNINAPRHGYTMEETEIRNNYTTTFRRGYEDGVRKVKEVMMQKVAQYGGDKQKKSMNPFATPKPTAPSSRAVNNVKYSSVANNKLLQNDVTPLRSSIPKGIILRMEYLGWI